MTMKVKAILISCVYALPIQASSSEDISGIRQLINQHGGDNLISRSNSLLATDDRETHQETLPILADLSKDEETCLKMIQDPDLTSRLVDILSASRDGRCQASIFGIFEQFAAREAGLQKLLQYPNAILKLHPFKYARPLLRKIYYSKDGSSTIASIIASLLNSGDASTLSSLFEQLPFLIDRERFSEIIDHPDILPGVVSLFHSQGENMKGLRVGLSVMASIENGPEKLMQIPQTIPLLTSLLRSDKISDDIMCIFYHLARDPKVNKLIAGQKGVITRLVQIMGEEDDTKFPNQDLGGLQNLAELCLRIIANHEVFEWPGLENPNRHYGWIDRTDVGALLEKAPELSLEAIKLIAHRFRIESFVQEEARLNSIVDILSSASSVPKSQIAIIFGSLGALDKSFSEKGDDVNRKDLLRLAMIYQTKNYFGDKIMRSFETSPVFTQCEKIKDIVRRIYKHGGKRYLKDGDLLEGHFELRYAGKIKKVEDARVLTYLHKEFKGFKDLALASENGAEVEDLIEFWNMHITNPNDVLELIIGADETSLDPEDHLRVVKGVEDLILALDALNQLQQRIDEPSALDGLDHELDKIANVRFVSQDGSKDKMIQKTILDYGFPKRQKRKAIQKTIFDFGFSKQQKREMEN